MPLATVRFSHIFDLVRMAHHGDHCTLFSFDADIGTRYGARIEGHPRIEAGMQVTAWLGRAGDWSTIVGWRDHATGEIVTPGAASQWGALLMFSCIATVSIHLATPPFWPGLLAFALPFYPAVSLSRIYRARRALAGAVMP